MSIRSERIREARARGRHNQKQWVSLLAMCQNRCVRCGETKSLTKDHIVPIYSGGSDAIDNLQPLCRPCNSARGAGATDYRSLTTEQIASLGALMSSIKIGKHECPECGAWHRRREGADLVERARGAAQARWAAVGGEVAERLKAPVLKTGVGEIDSTPPKVRTLPSPPTAEEYHCPRHRAKDPKCPYCNLG